MSLLVLFGLQIVLIHRVLTHRVVLILILSLALKARWCTFVVGWCVRVSSPSVDPCFWDFEHAALLALQALSIVVELL